MIVLRKKVVEIYKIKNNTLIKIQHCLWIGQIKLIWKKKLKQSQIAFFHLKIQFYSAICVYKNDVHNSHT